MWVLWNLISVHLEIVLVPVQDRSIVCKNVPYPHKPILTHLMELLGDVGHVESRFSLFGDSVSIGAR
jgi:hypothetical protein